MQFGSSQRISLSGKTPEIEAKSSEFAADWMAALDNPSHDDVTFVLASGKRIQAHRLILSAASTFFAKVIGMDESREVKRFESVSNYIYYKMWDNIAYPVPNFNGCTVEVWKWISNFTPRFTGHVITWSRSKIVIKNIQNDIHHANIQETVSVIECQANNNLIISVRHYFPFVCGCRMWVGCKGYLGSTGLQWIPLLKVNNLWALSKHSFTVVE